MARSLPEQMGEKDVQHLHLSEQVASVMGFPVSAA